MDFFLSPVFCKTNEVIILETTEEQVLIGMVDFDNNDLKLRISKSFEACVNKFCEKSILLDFIPLEKEEFNRLLFRLFALTESSGENIENPKQVENENLLDADAPIINLLDSLILDAISLKASDIHFEPIALGGFRVRFRRGGFLSEHLQLSPTRADGLFLRIKLMANMNLLEKRHAQDGHFSFSRGLNGRKVDVRVSVVPSFLGETMVLRILDSVSIPLSLDSLGFSKNQLSLIKTTAQMENSLVIVAGPTGAGKSTTLASLLLFIKNYWGEKRKIISMEDPVEYVLDGVTQIEIDKKLDRDFEDALRRVFRQDPDILMIGEIRDEVSAKAAVRASLSGHLVFATIHASSSSEVALRLLDLGIPSYVLSSTLRLIICQHLVLADDEKRVLKAEVLSTTTEWEKAVFNCLSRKEIEQAAKSV